MLKKIINVKLGFPLVGSQLNLQRAIYLHDYRQELFCIAICHLQCLEWLKSGKFCSTS